MIVWFVVRELWRRALRHDPWFDISTLDIGNTVPLVRSRRQNTRSKEVIELQGLRLAGMTGQVERQHPQALPIHASWM